MTLEALLGKFDDQFQTLKQCQKNIDEAWAYFSSHKSEMTSTDKTTAYELLQKTKKQLDQHWQEWKERRHELIAQRNRERDERREEREAKRERWLQNQREFISRLEGAEFKLTGALARRQEHLDELISQRDSAWSDKFRERVEGWIDEERQNITEIEAKLDDVRTKLSDAKIRLGA